MKKYVLIFLFGLFLIPGCDEFRSDFADYAAQTRRTRKIEVVPYGFVLQRSAYAEFHPEGTTGGDFGFYPEGITGGDFDLFMDGTTGSFNMEWGTGTTDFGGFEYFPAGTTGGDFSDYEWDSTGTTF